MYTSKIVLFEFFCWQNKIWADMNTTVHAYLWINMHACWNPVLIFWVAERLAGGLPAKYGAKPLTDMQWKIINKHCVSSSYKYMYLCMYIERSCVCMYDIYIIFTYMYEYVHTKGIAYRVQPWLSTCPLLFWIFLFAWWLLSQFGTDAADPNFRKCLSIRIACLSTYVRWDIF